MPVKAAVGQSEAARQAAARVYGVAQRRDQLFDVAQYPVAAPLRAARLRRFGGPAQPWLELAIALAAFAGCRLGEVLAMVVQDVDPAGSWFTIRRALSDREVLTPKNNKARVVRARSAAAASPARRVALKTPRARRVLNSNGRTPTRQFVFSALNHIAGRLQLPARNIHSLRHLFCSTLIRRGGSVEAVRMLAGHSKKWR